MPGKNRLSDHPYYTSVSGGLRFVVEIIAWVAGPWAAAGGGTWLAAPAAVILIGLPAVFSTKGDKHRVFVSTPGPVRVLIELMLHVVAVAGAWAVWPPWLAAVLTVVVTAALITGLPRLGWLLRGAPADAGRAPPA